MRLSSFRQTNEPGVFDQVKTEICRAVALLADNYSDDFKPFAQQFALAIWSLLTRLNLSPSFDEVTVVEDHGRHLSPSRTFLADQHSDEISLDIGRSKSSLQHVRRRRHIENCLRTSHFAQSISSR